jgi:hypothetical protein
LKSTPFINKIISKEGIVMVNTKIFDNKPVSNELIFEDVYSLVSVGITKPDFPQGKVLLTIKRIEVQEGYGNFKGNKTVKAICEDDNCNNFTQVFFIKNGISNNLAKFICEALGYEPEGSFNIKQLEGKRIEAIIAHFYKDNGVGHANLVFCKPSQN